MLCQVCKEAEATVHLTQIIGGKARKLDLCAACAEKCGIDDPAGFSMIEILKKFAGAFGEVESEKPAKAEKQSLTLRCPVCGYTDQNMSKTGRLGCPACYTTFEKSLEKVIKTMHRGTHHIGKCPLNRAPEPQPPSPPASAPKKAKGTRKKSVTSAKVSAKMEDPSGVSPEKMISLMEKLLDSKKEILQQSIAAENYEYAATVRDEIKALDEKIEKVKKLETKAKKSTKKEDDDLI